MKTALITGITGQDGSYLTELLIDKGYTVHGLVRRSSTFNRSRLDGIYSQPRYKESRLVLHYGDLTDSSSISRLLDKVQPEEIYNLGGQTHVQVSFEVPEYTAEVDALGTLRVLDALREMKIKSRFYQASTSELFGKVRETPQNESTPFYPRSPYGVAKLYSYWLVINYREAYSMHASNGILFNHESPRRSENFVSRKVSLGVAAIVLGRAKCISLGNLDAKRDWGYAPEYVEGMWKIMQLDHPDDFVLATGETHSVREFVSAAFEVVGKPVVWKGGGVEEHACLASGGEKVVEVNPAYFRPAEVDCLMGDAGKARKVLGWEAKTKFKELVRIMVEADLKLMESSPSRSFVI